MCMYTILNNNKSSVNNNNNGIIIPSIRIKLHNLEFQSKLYTILLIIITLL